LTATVSSEIFKAAQPALLYLVPFTLLPLLTMAYLKVSTELMEITQSIQPAIVSLLIQISNLTVML
jgi:Signal peptide peptidase